MDKDISTLLKEVKAATSWSEPRIAVEIGTSQPTVNRILRGQVECKGSTLRAITELHQKQCVDLAGRRCSDVQQSQLSAGGQTIVPP